MELLLLPLAGIMIGWAAATFFWFPRLRKAMKQTKDILTIANKWEATAEEWKTISNRFEELAKSRNRNR